VGKKIEDLIKRTDRITDEVYYSCAHCDVGFIFEMTLLNGGKETKNGR
jgi:hypothetical protein